MAEKKLYYWCSFMDVTFLVIGVVAFHDYLMSVIWAMFLARDVRRYLKA